MDVPSFTQEAEQYVLRIPSGMQLRETVSFSAPDNADISIIAEEDSQSAVSIILEGSASVTVDVAMNATLTIVTLQSTNGTVSQKSSVAEGATVHFQNVSLAEEVEHQLRSHLKGPHAVSNVDWIFYAKNTEKHRISARNIFEAKNGGGEIVMKGIAENKAHVLCDGMIEIGLQGGGTDTYLTENVLMLDSSAKVDAIPGLEIKTNDVKASHSATVSKVTGEDLFYFAARGIAEDEARHMYIQGFLSELTAKISDSTVQQSLLEYIEAKLTA